MRWWWTFKAAAQPSGLLPERVAVQARQAIVRGTAAGTWRLQVSRHDTCVSWWELERRATTSSTN
jgi:hypothetical protein